LAADVPVGVMLSGGLDSSAVAAAAVELGHKQFHTFSVAFAEGGAFSELAYARQMAKSLGVEHHSVVVDRPTFLEMLPQAVRAADEPLADLTIVPLLAVARLARERVKVVLSGEGADEILAGYDLDVSQRRFQIIKRLQNFPSSVLKPLATAVEFCSSDYGEKFARTVRIPLSEWNATYKAHMTRLWNEQEKSALWPAFPGRESDRILGDM